MNTNRDRDKSSLQTWGSFRCRKLCWGLPSSAGEIKSSFRVVISSWKGHGIACYLSFQITLV